MLHLSNNKGENNITIQLNLLTAISFKFHMGKPTFLQGIPTSREFHRIGVKSFLQIKYCFPLIV